MIIRRIETFGELIDAIRLRVDIFIKEQGCAPGWEPDEDDKQAIQYVALLDNRVVATGRALQTGPTEYKIQRMAIDASHRKQGIGSQLLEFMVADLQKQNPKRFWMQSQVHAQPFYEKHGFRAISKPYNLHGIMHVDMEKECL